MEDNLELLIDRATDQTKNHDTSDHFVAVWDRINKETDGPQVALRYLIQKVRSVNERESLCSLELIEACVKNCGSRFHQEIGKFKFLNELVKLLSTKYDGGWTPASVKARIIELLYSWTKGLPRETKILDAYKMLKNQGLITSDPVDPYKSIYPKEMQHPKNTIFDDEEKSKLLARLLKSKHPEDLQAANRLIKTMVRQDEIKTEKIVKRNMDIEQSVNNARLLSEMLSHYQPSSPSQDKELMKELFSSCEKMRPSLFRLASAATEEGDGGLGEILKANDELTKAIDEYRRKIGTESGGKATPASPAATPASSTATSASSAATPEPIDTTASSLIDLGQHQENNGVVDTNSSVLDDELKALGIHDTPNTMASQPTTIATSDITALSWGSSQSAQSFVAQTQAGTNNVGMVRPMGYPGTTVSGPMNPVNLPGQQFTRTPMNQSYSMQPGMGISMVGPGGQRIMQGMNPGIRPLGAMAGTPMSGYAPPRGPPPANKRGPEALKKPTSSLDVLGLDMLQDQKLQQKQKQPVSPLPQSTDQTLLSLSSVSSAVNQCQPPERPLEQNTPANNDSSSTDTLLSLGTDTGADLLTTPITRVSSEPEPLDNVFIPLDSVLPGNHQPLTVLDKNGLKMVFHFAKTTAKLSRTDVAIVVISIMSTRSTAISNFVLQAAVPRAMKVRLQPPSGTDLPAHNPILPAAAITQVMLIANPNKETIRLKYRATYETDGTTSVEAGEVTSFPSL
ncbi:ADP-ribosylation factor-binding protein GGA2-like [Actinia tenebrosa]|uniref:ADP-ribosylation factor-binding protein GGA2-like n=1 Tax=Actinia tenebrosa TaxID=6105 RepID=A0A6P8ICM4_ACTTE|nr:ADP-ribosylation factor-binding protein GGA2-like [Actinia tenebrosa]